MANYTFIFTFINSHCHAKIKMLINVASENKCCSVIIMTHTLRHNAQYNKASNDLMQRQQSPYAFNNTCTVTIFTIRGGSRAAATLKMERFVKPLTIITKHSISHVATALDPPLTISARF